MCDVFGSASRGAAAAFIASSAPVPSSGADGALIAQDITRPAPVKKQQQQQQQQQQTSNMLVMCALACVYELVCRHWKLVLRVRWRLPLLDR